MNFRNAFENLFIYGLCILLLLHEVYKRFLLVLSLFGQHGEGQNIEVHCTAFFFI
jgi:hypothetical protein